MNSNYDYRMRSGRNAVIVGSGPNGLSAAITMARAGFEVTVFEAEATIGGGTRSAELTLPGYVHDVCSAIHPLGIASPFFRSLPLDAHGLAWIHPPAPLAHPLDDGTAAVLARAFGSLGSLGADAGAWERMFQPLVRNSEVLLGEILAPLIRVPRHPVLMARFGLGAIRSARGLANAHFHGAPARALFAGAAAHSFLSLRSPFSATFGLMLGLLGHAAGWPLPRGGSQKIADALASYLKSLGGNIETGHRIASAADLPPADAVLFDVSPRQLLAIGGDKLPSSYRRRLSRFRYGPAAFKMDWALDAPIPWRAEACRSAGTVHVGGTLEEISAAEDEVMQGRCAQRPFVLVAQPTVFDTSRAPTGKHVAWAYCHVPLGSTIAMSERIEAQIERFAPGFRDTILARSVMAPAELERHNSNLVGGDIVGGSNDMIQLIGRPVISAHPYAVPVKGWFLCSASTPPGGGVHGMAGFHAARAALRALPG